jgi:hypothetical protein
MMRGKQGRSASQGEVCLQVEKKRGNKGEMTEWYSAKAKTICFAAAHLKMLSISSKIQFKRREGWLGSGHMGNLG